MMKKIFKPFVILAFSLITVLSISGCSNPLVVSDEVRYSKINEILELIDYKTVGTITEEEYDQNNGFTGSASWVKITYENKNNTALELYTRLKNIPEVICDNNVFTPKCNYKGVEISISVVSPEKQNDIDLAGIFLNDSSNGKGSND